MKYALRAYAIVVLLAVATVTVSLLGGCTATQVAQTNAALIAAEAVNTDLVDLKAQVTASGSTVTPAELTALDNAITAATAGVALVESGNTNATGFFASIQPQLTALEEFLPAVATLVAAFAAPAPAPAALTAVQMPYPALANLAADLGRLRAAG